MLCAAICGVLTFQLPFFSGHRQTDPAKGVVIDYLKASGTPWLVILGVIIIVAILVNIFNFKKRRQQLLITIVLVLLSLLNIVLFWFASRPPHYIDGTFALSALLALAIPVFLILAARGISKDQRLVKSADRLR